MAFNDEIYEVEFTEDCIEEIQRIYEYISKILIADRAAKKIIQEIKQKVLSLSKYPKLYTAINKFDKFNRQYRRMIIKNYVILYIVDDKKKKVYLSHMYYGRQNYLGNTLI